MSDKNIEMMKKLIEQKKNKNTNQGVLRPSRYTPVDQRERKAIRTHKQGGVFD